MKPYRILSECHVNQVRQILTPIFHAWNLEYAQSEIHFYLQKEFMEPDAVSLMLVHDDILADKNYISHINCCLFGADHPACTDTGRHISQILFNRIAGETSANGSAFYRMDWFYNGSSCLKLTILDESQETDFYLHPDWVFQKLEKRVSNRMPLVSIEKALQPLSLDLSVRFKPFNLPLRKIANLKAGNLISMDHSINHSLEVCHGRTVIAKAKSGQHNQHRNIIIQ